MPHKTLKQQINYYAYISWNATNSRAFHPYCLDFMPHNEAMETARLLSRLYQCWNSNLWTAQAYTQWLVPQIHVETNLGGCLRSFQTPKSYIPSVSLLFLKCLFPDWLCHSPGKLAKWLTKGGAQMYQETSMLGVATPKMTYMLNIHTELILGERTGLVLSSGTG